MIILALTQKFLLAYVHANTHVGLQLINHSHLHYSDTANTYHPASFQYCTLYSILSELATWHLTRSLIPIDTTNNPIFRCTYKPDGTGGRGYTDVVISTVEKPRSSHQDKRTPLFRSLAVLQQGLCCYGSGWMEARLERPGQMRTYDSTATCADVRLSLANCSRLWAGL